MLSKGRRNSKESINLVETVSTKRIFHSEIALVEKENLKIFLVAVGTRNLKSWLPRVILSLLGMRYCFHLPFKWQWRILYTVVSLDLLLIVSSVTHFRLWSMLVTLVVRSYGPVQKWTASLCTLSTAVISYKIWSYAVQVHIYKK